MLAFVVGRGMDGGGDVDMGWEIVEDAEREQSRISFGERSSSS
jgi:hypothetical protein